MKMKYFSLIALVVLLGMFCLIPAANAIEAEAPSVIKVTIPKFIGFRGLDPIAVTNMVFDGTPPLGHGDGSDSFTVEANVNTTISSEVTDQPIDSGTGDYLTSSLSVAAGTPGSTSDVLTAAVAGVPLDVTPGDYVGEITVTAVED